MDIQFILDPNACVMHIASYMLKSERSMGELLKQVSKETSGKEVRSQLRLLGSVFLNHREVSGQEAVYRILSLPLKQLSRKVVFINTDTRQERVSILKKPKMLDEMDKDDPNIFQTSLIERYAARPTILDNMCLAEFAANFTTRSGQHHDEDSNDALPKPDEGNEVKAQRIHLNNGLGYMYKRRRETVVRFHKFSLNKQSSKVYRSKLMPYLPWRNEDSDILGGYMTYKARYDDLSDDVMINEHRYSRNASVIDDAVGHLNEHGPPQHAWDQLAPGTEEQEVHDRAQGVEDERSIEQEDLDANAQMFQQQQSAPILQRFTSETNRRLMSPEEYRAQIRQLNTKLRQVINFHRRWCKSAVVSLRTNQPVTPYRLFLSGPGGVGKSHVISLIHHDTIKLLRLSGQMQPDDVAAFNYSLAPHTPHISH